LISIDPEQRGYRYMKINSGKGSNEVQNLKSDFYVSVGFIFKFEEYFDSIHVMFFYLKRMYFDNKWNKFMKEFNTRKHLQNTTDTVLRFLLVKENCEIYFALKTALFCL
jgi:hypothetical protein